MRLNKEEEKKEGMWGYHSIKKYRKITLVGKGTFG